MHEKKGLFPISECKIPNREGKSTLCGWKEILDKAKNCVAKDSQHSLKYIVSR